MDIMEAATAEESGAICEILAARRQRFAGGHQHRLYFTEQFTDDSAAAILGVDRTVRYLLAWFEVTTRFNIMMAPPRKRQLGCKLHWVGAVFLAVGLLTTQLQKRVRAVAELKLLLAGRLTRAALQKLLGLLQHLTHVFALKQNMTAALYEGLGSHQFDADGALIHPEERVQPSQNMRSSAGRWVKYLASRAGSTLLKALCGRIVASARALNGYFVAF